MIDLYSILRKPIAFDIELSNPLDEPAIFEVDINGDGLDGNPNLILPPKSSTVYELIYMPLKV